MSATIVERTCEFCSEPLPANATAKQRFCCRACRLAAYNERTAGARPSSSRERVRRACVNACYGHKLIDAAPDPEPAIGLRRHLAEDRALGMAFDDVWAENVAVVLRNLHGDELITWYEALSATEPAWRSAYGGFETNGSTLTADLLVEAA